MVWVHLNNMPVDNSTVNSIINAFMQGHQFALQKKQEVTRQQERAQDITIAQKNREEDIARAKEQRDLENKRQNAIDSVNAALRNLQIAHEEANTYSTTGDTQPNYVETNAESVPIDEGIAGTRHTFATSQLGMPNFKALDPISSALLEAKRQSILLEPKTQEAIRVKQAEDEANRQKELKKQEFDAEQNRLKRENDREIAKLRASATNNPKKKLELWNETPVSDVEAELYGVPAGTLHKEIIGKNPGVKLSTDQQNKISYIDGMIQDALDAKTLLDPEKGGVGYNKYFYGTPGVKGVLSGSVSEALASRKGESDPTLSEIRNRLAAGFDKQKVESAGKVLNAAELKILNSYSIPYEHTMNPTQAKSNLEQFIANAIRTKESIQSGAANRVVNSKVNISNKDIKGEIDLSNFEIK